jgi:hypothetical protein
MNSQNFPILIKFYCLTLIKEIAISRTFSQQTAPRTHPSMWEEFQLEQQVLLFLNHDFKIGINLVPF